MRIPLCLLVLAMSAWASDTTADNLDTPDQTPAAAAATAPAPAPPPPPAKLNGFVISGLADGYLSLNFNHPNNPAYRAGGNNQLHNFDLNFGQPELSFAKITIDKSDKMLGFHVDAGIGQTMRFIHGADPAAIDHKALRYFEQMYVIAKPGHTHGTEIDFGQFVTSAGAEVIESTSNWNYTRSFLFAFAIPYYHFGLRTSTPITKTFTAGFQLVSAWNTLAGNNNLNNIGLNTTLTKEKYTWSVVYYEGPNHPGTLAGKRNLLDSNLLLTPNSKVNFYINGDYGRDNRIGTGAGYDQWYGLAAAAHIQLSKVFAISPRVEFFNDSTGYTTGTKQVLKEGTITGEYKYNDHMVARIDYRHDMSNQAFFDRGAQFAKAKAQSTVAIGLVYLLGPIK